MNPRIVIRLVQAGLVLAAAALAAVPLFVMLDLARGGTGYGLCPGGVSRCRNPYTAAPELTIVLTVALFVILGAFRVTTRALRRYSSSEVPPSPR